MTLSRFLVGIMLLLLVTGCQKDMFSVRKPSVQQQLLQDVRLRLSAGDATAARTGLEQLLAAAPQYGITDEAIFRRALLALNEEEGSALNLLNRLQQQYPGSIWNHQAAPLRSYLSRVKNLQDRQRELATLKSLNLSLHKDNRELRQTLERLKALDLELEQRIRR